MGRANAPVLPEPVCASPIKSFPKIEKPKQNQVHEYTTRIKGEQCNNKRIQKRE